MASYKPVTVRHAREYNTALRHSRTSLNAKEELSGNKRKKNIWNSFMSKTKRIRGRSREKLSKKNKEDDLALSMPDVSNGYASDGAAHSYQDYDDFLDTEPVRRTARKSRSSTAISSRNYPQAGDRIIEDQRVGRDLQEVRKSGERESDSGIGSGETAAEGSNRNSSYGPNGCIQLDFVLMEGRDLVARDASGTSDPYVAFKVGSKQLYRSRTVFKSLTPWWDEKFTVFIDDPIQPIRVKVMDWDRGVRDDAMGEAYIDVGSLELNQTHELKLTLKAKEGKSTTENMGYLNLSVTPSVKSAEERAKMMDKTASKSNDGGKKGKGQTWNGICSIVLVEGKDFYAMDDNGFSDPYVKFRLGNERCKSKWKPKTLNPRWVEHFDMRMYEDQSEHLEISTWDHDSAGKDDFMGRAVLDLSDLEREKTHAIDVQLEDDAGIVCVLLTITGLANEGNESDLNSYNENPQDRKNVVSKYGILKTLKGIKDIGWLQVKVLKAQGLASADLGGKSDPFCVLELVNARTQTQTEYKTLSPEWNKVFTFNIKDIHSVLEVSVYDEDRDRKCEFLGKVVVPLLRVKGRERRWYQLKDKKALVRGKGAILLEMDVVFNDLKAAIRTVNPREDKYMQPEPKFKLAILKRNIDRVSKLAQAGVEVGNFLQTCFDWKSKPRSIAAFAIYLIMVWNFELFYLPLGLLLLYLKNLLIVHIAGRLMDAREDEYVDEEDDEDDDEKEKGKGAKDEKKSFKEKLQAIQDICLQVQEGMDMVASSGERVKNTFNWTVPWLSWLAVIALSIASVGLYYIPLRYILLAWGINKFTKKLRAPNAIPNNELLDYLSRLPSDKELMMYRDLRPDADVGTQKKRKT